MSFWLPRESSFNFYCSNLSVRSVKSTTFNLNEGSLILSYSFGVATNYCESRSTGKISEPANFRASRYLAQGSSSTREKFVITSFPENVVFSSETNEWASIPVQKGENNRFLMSKHTKLMQTLYSLRGIQPKHNKKLRKRNLGCFPCR